VWEIQQRLDRLTNFRLAASRQLILIGCLCLRIWVQKIVVVILDRCEDTRPQAIQDGEVLSPLVSRSGIQVGGGEHGEKTETHCAEKLQDCTLCLLAVMFADCDGRRQRDAQSKAEVRTCRLTRLKALGSEI
jgi:hypothetical protein